MIKNFGSINIDNVYRLANLPKAGETLTALDYDRFLGGKGLNQSVAAYLAGGNVQHIGAVGGDGDWALDQMAQMGLNTDDIIRVEQPTGNAVVCVDIEGENQIVVLGGANQSLDSQNLQSAFDGLNSTDWVILQNETSAVSQIVDMAKSKGCRIAYSAAPFSKEQAIPLLDKIDLLAVNQYEAQELANATNREVNDLGVPMVLTTFGGAGAELNMFGSIIKQNAFNVKPVDTTGAGDTFLGSFMAKFDLTNNAKKSLEYAAAASAIQVTRFGAAVAIPTHVEVDEFMTENFA